MKEISHFEHYFSNLPTSSKTHCGQTRSLPEKTHCKTGNTNQDADDQDLHDSLQQLNLTELED